MTDLFNAGVGFGIEEEASGEIKLQHFITSGVPGNAGLTAEELLRSDNAPLGSKATNILTGLEYRKNLVGAGESTWAKTADATDITASNTSDSWRLPAKLKDDTVYASLAAAETAVNTGTIDGITLLDGDRLLLTGIAGESKNVFIVTGTPGSGATLVEDGNDASHNDALIVNEGTFVGREFHYNSVSVDWIDSGSNGSDEDGFQNTYTGKPVTGSILPGYTSTTVVANNDNLTVAAGKLDAASATNAAAIALLVAADVSIQGEVDGIETAIGTSVDANGDYVARTGTDYLDANTDITEDIDDLAAQIKLNEDAIANSDNVPRAVATGITTTTVVDFVLVDAVKMTVWQVHIQQGANIRSYEVPAIHDGTTGSDATDKDNTKYAKLSLGSNIAGLKVTTSLTGIGAAQQLNLVVESTAAVTVSTTRTDVL